jgi:indole-3-pyruvate monooxygenase
MMDISTQVDVVVVGAGPAGLAVSACLKRLGISFVILERAEHVGSAWRRHYERLHLHTDKARSALPFLPIPREYPKYPSREQVVTYLETYARRFDLEPKFGQSVDRAHFNEGLWHSQTADTVYVSRALVVATGFNGHPVIPQWPGQEAFSGEILHSSAYRNGAPYRGRRVLVVGFGNSGGEIAIDLWEHGAKPSMSVRNPVKIIPRDLLGLPVLAIAIPLRQLPYRIADALTAPIIRLKFGDLRRLGLREVAGGPFEFMRSRSRVPLIDVGTVGLIRRGQITVRPGIERFRGDGVEFVDGTKAAFDAVVLATGYRPAVNSFLDGVDAVIDAEGTPRSSGQSTVMPGLYFCGFYVSPTGMLREISIEAPRIVSAISTALRPLRGGYCG